MREETSISEDGSRSDALILVASSVVQVIGYEGARFSDRFYLAAILRRRSADFPLLLRLNAPQQTWKLFRPRRRFTPA